MNSAYNYAGVYGTSPSQNIKAESKLAKAFFCHVKHLASESEENKINIPDDIQSFTGHNGKAETKTLGQPTSLICDPAIVLI